MRNIKIDQIKGAAILGVIFIHGSQFSGGHGFLHEITYAISRVAVPYFITLFCYFMEKSLTKNENHMSIYVGRFNKLLIPFLSWSLMYFILTANFSYLVLNPIKIFTMYWSGYGWSGQYFFILLFQLIIVFPLIRRLAENNIVRWFSLIITGILCIYNTYVPELVPHVLAKISDRLVIYWIPYAFLGIIMARREIKNQSHTIQHKAIQNVWLLSAIALIPCEYFFGFSSEHPISEYLKISILSVSYITLPVLLSLSGSIKGKVGNILSCFGFHSMALFVLNPLIIIILKRFSNILAWESLWLSYILSLLVCMLVASLALFAALIIRKSFLWRLI